MAQKIRKKAGSARAKRNRIDSKLSGSGGFQTSPVFSKSRYFYLEFNWCDEAENQTNEATHRAQVRHLAAKERVNWMRMFRSSGEVFYQGESVESKILQTYLQYYLCAMRDRNIFNRAFVYPIAGENQEPRGAPIYELRATPEFCKPCLDQKGLDWAIDKIIGKYVRHDKTPR